MIDLSRHDNAECDRGLTEKIFSTMSSDRTLRVIDHHPGFCFGHLNRHQYGGHDLPPDADKWNVAADEADEADGGEHHPFYWNLHFRQTHFADNHHRHLRTPGDVRGVVAGSDNA